MIYRRDLIEHFAWLSGSEFFDEVIDEALVSVAMAAHGHDWDLVETGAAWMTAGGLVERFDLGEFVDRARSELLI